jgi:MFS family permease
MRGGLLAPMAQMMMARAAGRRMVSVLGFAAMPILAAPILGPVIAGAILQFASWHRLPTLLVVLHPSCSRPS